MIKKEFVTLENGEKASLYTLQNKNGMEVDVTDLGVTLVSIRVPKDGKMVDVILGYETPEQYIHSESCQGATIGRNANRIANGSFTLNGVTYTLEKNDSFEKHNLHSGSKCLCGKIWEVEVEETEDGEALSFSTRSEDMEQGYPGNLDVQVTVMLTDENELMLSYFGISDQDTLFNMTNHAYFNLNGNGSGNILGHKLQIFSDAITELNEELIPTGKLLPVAGTPFDFREEKTIGQDIEAENDQLRYSAGYDHNFILNDGQVAEEANLVAKCTGDQSKITMEVYTNLPGMQIYAGNLLEEAHGKDKATYKSFDAVCFETQFYPDSINQPDFPSPVLKAGEEGYALTVYRFI